MKHSETKSNILKIFIAAILISIAYGTLFIMPIYIKSLNGDTATAGYLFAITGIGAMVSILFTKRLVYQYSGNYLLFVGALFFSIGVIIFGTYHQVDVFYFIASAFTGIGWGIYYNVSPIMLMAYSDNSDNRVTLFGYLSAFNVIGISLAPIVIDIIYGENINYFIVFAITGGVCSFCAAFLFLSISNNVAVKDSEKINPKDKMITDEKKKGYIYPLLMVFLGACTLSLMSNFQTVFSKELGVNYFYFFLSFSLSMVLSRLLLSAYIAKLNRYYTNTFFLLFMVISLVLFFFAEEDVLIYVLASSLFGMAYGLVYPIIQDLALLLSSPQIHKDVLSYFSFSYFIGLYLFSAISGVVIDIYGYLLALFVIVILALIELLLSVILIKKFSKEYRQT
ncbi:MFS transporter [Aquimarina hainanensis]|uniref:MFS transporter n=1 Tax=Aquimarina hainanensis TaxID=1578017 RepID=A0ABW5N3A9_9FLAO|nr:MFS transporter [Aquimarina sp. TRL1]QKX04279.1 MFS transporter [Aquimarina sp. TRL1]